MNRLTYDASMLVGVLLIGAGVWVRVDAGGAMIVVGALVIALTIVGAVIAAKR